MIGVSRKQVKAKGAELLPPAPAFRIQQATGRPTAAALAAHDQLLVVTPATLPPALLRRAPYLAGLARVATRLGKPGRDKILRGPLGPRGGKGIALGRLTAEAGRTPFGLLRFAGQLVQAGLDEEPRSLGVLVEGFPSGETARILRALVLALLARGWHGPRFQREAHPSALRTVRLLGLGSRLDLDREIAEAGAANLVRWLTALPPNKLDAPAYRRVIAHLADLHGWEYRFLDEAALGRLGAGAFLAVAQGNAARDAGIVHLRRRPAGRRGAPDLALVGKGILFDTGGNNLKTAKSMLDMHTDMSGSAVALGVLQALTVLDSPLAVDCWLAITENRIGPTAYRQRDVVTAANGLSIEVMHSDAEGRMALADTLALAGREKPRLMIDYATLTGACVYAVTERYSGVFTSREDLNDLLVAAGRTAGERVWPFPMDEDFDEDLKSTVADLLQCTLAGEGDHILAARFLRRFVPEHTPWVHVDLASVTRKEGLAQMPGGPTGFGVRLTLALLLDHRRDLDARVGGLAGKPAGKP